MALTEEELRERRRENARRYYYENKERVKLTANKWNKENPEKRRELQNTRYWLKKGNQLVSPTEN